jgi:hypothetical protein
MATEPHKVTQPEVVEVLMEDGSWQPADVKVTGRGDPSQVGGDGWRLVRLHDEIEWWAEPGEWRPA